MILQRDDRDFIQEQTFNEMEDLIGNATYVRDLTDAALARYNYLNQLLWFLVIEVRN